MLLKFWQEINMHVVQAVSAESWGEFTYLFCCVGSFFPCFGVDVFGLYRYLDLLADIFVQVVQASEAIIVNELKNLYFPVVEDFVAAYHSICFK